MANYTALKAGDWNDTSIWFDALQEPPTPAGPPGAGDLVSISVSGTFTGNASVEAVLIVDTSVTFTGAIAVTDNVGMSNVSPSTPMTVAVSGGGLSGGNKFTVGNYTTLAVSGGARIVGPQSGTSGLQDGGRIVVNGGSIKSGSLAVTALGVLDLETGSGAIATLEVAGPAGMPASLTIASGGSISDTIATLGSITNGTATATIGGQWVNQQLTIGAEGTANAGISGSGSLATDSLTVGGGPFAHATLALAGGTATVGGDLVVALRGTGELTFSAGGVSVTGALEAGSSADGAADFNVAGGAFGIGGDAVLGDLGTGNMTLGAAGQVSVGGTLTLGAQAGGTGVLALAGANALVDAAVLVVGADGIGTAGIGDQGEISTTGAVTVGATQARADSSGTLTLATGGALSDGGDLLVGDGGTGVFSVDGGTVSLLGSTFTVGNAASGNGEVTVQNSTVALTGTLTMGNLGRADVSVNTQGALNATSMILGAAIGSNGAFALDGHGSSAQSGDITVGAAGVGGVQVTGGAALHTTGNATIARDGGPVQQTVTIDSGASWQIGGELAVGLGGPAGLLVRDAGQVSAGQVGIGEQNGSDGTVVVSGTAGGVASALGAATLAVGGSPVAAGGTGTLTIDAGATVTVGMATIWPAGSVALAGGALLTDPAAVEGVLSGFGTVSGAVSNAGSIIAAGGTLALTGALSGAGRATIDTGATLRLALGAAAASGIAFAAGGATLMLDDLGDTKGTIAGFTEGDTIAVNGVNADGKTYAAGLLTLTSGGTPVGTLAIAGGFSNSSFTLTPSAAGVAITVACFAAGTRIATPRGEVPIEELRAADLVLTPPGRAGPIIWIGHRAVNCRAHPDPTSVWPVRVAAGAFGPALPARDLFLSPDHAVFFAGALIPIRHLVNATTIAQRRRADVVYWHVELARHAVLLAEGLPCESYLDTGNRAAFQHDGPAGGLNRARER